MRGDDGMVISTGYGKLMKVLDPYRTQAAQRVAELGIQNLILATDAAMVVQAATASEIDHSSANGLV